MSDIQDLSLTEAVELGADDGVFFSNYFFPDETGQLSPPFHAELWDLFDGNRYSHAKIFRGGAKTTIVRHRSAKRIAYGMAHTVLFISKSEDHAMENVLWLQKQIEYNERYVRAFHLEPGKKWTGTDIEIWNRKFNYPIRVKALGIMGSVRGINVGGHRPDTIEVDDPCDEENTATPEGRLKMSDLFFGAVKESLVPESEDPTATLMLTQTPMAEGDLSDICSKSPDFATLTVGILDDQGNSRWPQRWSKEVIEEERNAAIARNQLSLWTREKLCLLVGREANEFLETWLKYWEILPPKAVYVGFIDPAPPLSDRARMAPVRTDKQAVGVCCYWRGNKYVVEYKTARDQDPDMVGKEMTRLQRKYPIRFWGVETVNYQRVLKWFLEREMSAGRLPRMNVIEIPSKYSSKSKFDRIRLAHVDRASNGRLFVHASHSEYVDQYKTFPNCTYKDLLDGVSMCDVIIPPGMEEGSGSVADESDIPSLDKIAGGEWRGAPGLVT